MPPGGYMSSSSLLFFRHYIRNACRIIILILHTGISVNAILTQSVFENYIPPFANFSYFTFASWGYTCNRLKIYGKAVCNIFQPVISRKPLLIHLSFVGMLGTALR